jgi:hypothetical protein
MTPLYLQNSIALLPTKVPVSQISKGLANDLAMERANDLAMERANDLAMERANDLAMERANALAMERADDLAMEREADRILLVLAMKGFVLIDKYKHKHTHRFTHVTHIHSRM